MREVCAIVIGVCMTYSYSILEKVQIIFAV